MKYILMFLIVGLALIAVALPEAPKVPLTKEEIEYGKKPYDFSSAVKRGMIGWDRETKDVRCYTVVLSPKHDGYISVCDYKIKNRYNGWDMRSNRFIYNGAKRTFKMIDR